MTPDIEPGPGIAVALYCWKTHRQARLTECAGAIEPRSERGSKARIERGRGKLSDFKLWKHPMGTRNTQVSGYPCSDGSSHSAEV